MSHLIRLSGIPVNNPLAELSIHTTGSELITAARQLFVLLVFQYSGYFLIIIPIGWWYRRRGPSSYGLTKAKHTWAGLLVAGLGTAALSEWLVLGVGFLNSLHPSKTEPWRQAFFDMSWRRWEFWLFSAVMSWALIPLLEELFFRGYCQRRLAEDWGNGPAIIGTACLFTFEHTQYQIANAYNVGMIMGLFLSAVGFGVVFAWTRSLFPAIVAHMIFDIPMTPKWQGILVLALITGSLFISRKGLGIAREVFSIGKHSAYWILALFSTVFAVAGTRVRGLEYVGLGMVVLAVVLEFLELRNKPMLEPSNSDFS
ncbi:MAG: CPBP family intramembrane metalloprotease [Acidobacteriota bacterium]|nr:CPBP family intramembrane metalloprotease [Acidobacteriota bacterium]